MGLEVANSIEDLDENWPLGTDNVSEGDDHVRLIKSVLKSQFPNLGQSAVTKTAEELNASGMPTGVVMINAAPAVPTGWLPCNGQEANRGTYSALYAAIGDAFGSGNGTTTFNLPNMQNRVPGGASSTNPIGASGGKDSWTKDDLPSHNHTIGQAGAHTHDMLMKDTGPGQGIGDYIDWTDQQGDPHNGDYENTGGPNNTLPLTKSVGNHSHTITANEGAGNTADNRQATTYFNYIIKT